MERIESPSSRIPEGCHFGLYDLYQQTLPYYHVHTHQNLLLNPIRTILSLVFSTLSVTKMNPSPCKHVPITLPPIRNNSLVPIPQDRTIKRVMVDI